MDINFDKLLEGITAGIEKDEIPFLYELAQDAPINRVLELGSFVGKSTIVLALAMQESEGLVIACDYFPQNATDWTNDHIIKDTYLDFWQNLTTRGLDKSVISIKQDIKTLLPTLGGQWGLIFIDAGHTVDQVLMQSIWAWDKLPKGGYLAWHDYDRKAWPDVKTTIDVLINKWDRKLIRRGFLVAIKK